MMLPFYVLTTMAQDMLVTNEGKSMTIYNLEISDQSIFFQLSNKADAPLQKMLKKDVLIIKKADGTKLDLNAPQAVTENNDNKIQLSTQPQGPKLLKISDLSEYEKKANDELIAKYNKKLILNKENLPIKEKDKNKNAHNAIHCLGINSKSILCNKDIELLFIAGYIVDSKAPYFCEKNQITEDVFSPTESFAVIVKNNSERTLYLDLANSFYISVNGKSFSYYTPSTTTKTSSQQKGAGVNLGAITNALGINGAAGTLAQGVNIGGGTETGTSTTTYTQRIIAIAPNSTYYLGAQAVFSQWMTQLIGGNIFQSEARPLLYDKNTNNGYIPTSPIKIGDCTRFEETNSIASSSVIVGYSYSEDAKDIIQLKATVYLKDEVGSKYKYSKHIFNNIRFEE